MTSAWDSAVAEEVVAFADGERQPLTAQTGVISLNGQSTSGNQRRLSLTWEDTPDGFNEPIDGYPVGSEGDWLPLANKPTGLFSYTGVAAGVNRLFVIHAACNVFYTLGQVANLKEAHRLIMTKGQFTYTGYDRQIYKSFNRVSALGSYAMSGYTVKFTEGRRVDATYTTYTVTGNARVIGQRKLPMVKGQFTFTGQALNMILDRGFHTIPYTYTGKAAILKPARYIKMAKGQYYLTPENADAYSYRTYRVYVMTYT